MTRQNITLGGSNPQAPAARPSICPGGPAHSYLIESPNGTHYVEGRCRNCGATKKYPAAHDDRYWMETR